MADELIPLTVTALTKYVKLKFDCDSNLQDVLVSGEISNFKRHSRGHFYFTIKDEGAQINAVMFSNVANGVKFEPTNGMQVVVTGNLSVYEAGGTYSIHVKKLTEDGVGNLYVAFNQLKDKLALAGKFDDIHKQSIPKMPKAIAVITSPTGAAVRDIITTIRRRSPNVKIYLYPALVQGDEAYADIVKKIRQVNDMELVDVIILGRGGGSIEDLWAFNEESVAEAIFDSKIPVISAVGHETDFTIADFVADMRAPTPTAAAEMAAPNVVDILMYLSQIRSRLNQGLRMQMNFKEQALARLTNHYIMKNPRSLFESRMLRLDQLEKELNQGLGKQVERRRERLSGLDVAMGERIKQNVSNAGTCYTLLITKLEILNPLSVLKKGYSIVSNGAGDAILDVNQLSVGDEVTGVLRKGKFVASVKAIEEG